ncbi:TonB-dependent receptor [Nguyenibacter sp. L1]|uniref:TonB-dependent receptor n=1 Tax=Nguyenibacter sp. L1 TaxID=3049350 RepID=UPI002B47BDE8|nr:TonB-dependent receptor [Nguyenibacter sp. L1]WRH89652.1 TonB-dependent receptor [Nguyenibacter sp. L1]
MQYKLRHRRYLLGGAAIVLNISLAQAADIGVAGRERVAVPAKHAKRPGAHRPKGEQLTVLGTVRSASASAARAVQRDAPNMVVVRTQAEIRKLPDINVAEALQRVPGVSLETDTGEGRFVNIRGLDSDLNGVTFGGVRLMPSNQSSPFGGSRAVALDAIPSAFVGALEVTKTTRPDQDAEALGGTIEVVPRRTAPNGRPFVEFDAGGGYEPLRGTPVVDGGIALGASFGLGGAHDHPAFGADGWTENPRPFSFIMMANFHNDQRGVDDAEESYSDQQASGLPDKLLSSLELRRYQYWRRRYSRGGEFDFDPDRDDHYFVRFSEAGYHERVARHRLLLSSLDSGAGGCDPYMNCLAGSPALGFIAPQATATQTLREEEETIQNDVVTLGGNNRLGQVKLDYHAAWSRGEDNRPYDYNSSFTDPSPFALQYNNIARPNTPAIATLDGTNLANPALYQFSGLTNNSQKNVDTEWSGGFNAAMPVAILHHRGTFKLGALVRLRKRSTTQVVYDYSPTGTIPYDNYVYGPDQIYYHGNYNIGPALSGSTNNLIGGSALVRDTAGDLLASGQGDQQDTENVYAGYVQYETNFGRLHMLTGMRFEDTQGTYNGSMLATDSGGNQSLSPARFKQSYFNYFPSLQFRYAFTPQLIGRLTYSTAIARPGFNQISPAIQVNYGTGSVTSGNPALKPTTGDDFDASLEYYMHNGGAVTLAAFDKQFHNYILPRQIQGTYPGIAGIAQIQSFSNVASAQAYGVEADYNQKFVFLPGMLRHVGFEGNYTWVNSIAQIRPGEDASLPSTSNNNFNAALYYEDGRLSVRVASNLTSRNLFAIGGSSSTDIYSAARFRLDLGATYAITRNLTFYADVKNLTNTPLKFTEGSSDSRPIQREVYYETVLSGIRANF